MASNIGDDDSRADCTSSSSLVISSPSPDDYHSAPTSLGTTWPQIQSPLSVWDPEDTPILHTVISGRLRNLYCRLLSWLRMLPNVKYLFAIALLETAACCCLLLAKAPGLTNAATVDVLLLPWTAFLGWLTQGRILRLRQVWGIGILLIGAAGSASFGALAIGWQTSYLMLVRLLACLPLSLSLLLREMLIFKYRTFALEHGSSLAGKRLADENLVTFQGNPSLSAPLLLFGVAAAQLALSPVAVFWTLDLPVWHLQNGQTNWEAQSLICAAINLVFDLVVLALLKRRNLLTILMAAQLIVPLTWSAFRLLPLPSSFQHPKREPSLWLELVSVIIGQWLYLPPAAPFDIILGRKACCDGQEGVLASAWMSHSMPTSSYTLGSLSSYGASCGLESEKTYCNLQEDSMGHPILCTDPEFAAALMAAA